MPQETRTSLSHSGSVQLKILLVGLIAASFGKPLAGAQKPLGKEYLRCVQSLASACQAPFDPSRVAELKPDPEVLRIQSLLTGEKNLRKHCVPLIQGEDLKTYLRLYREEEERVRSKGTRRGRLRFVALLTSRVAKLKAEEAPLKAFYLLRCLSVLSREEAQKAGEIFSKLQSILDSSVLPQLLAEIEGRRRLLAVGGLAPAERRLQESLLARRYVSAAVYLLDIGEFSAALDSIHAASALAGRNFKDVEKVLVGVVEARRDLAGRFSELSRTWSQSPEAARRYSLLLLSVFRRPEEAYRAMEASGVQSLAGLVTLLRTRSGKTAAAELLKELARNVEEPTATGLLLLALELYEQAGGRQDLPQAKKLRLSLNGRVDPREALILDPQSAFGGLSFRIFTEPRGSYVYVDGTLQAVSGSLIRTPCTVRGVRPGRRTITAVQLGFRDLVFRSRLTAHGLIIAGKQRSGRSKLLARAGKNLFLGKRFIVKGPLTGAGALFDGEVRALSTRVGFAAANWPCTFTIIFPRALRLSALRMKLWDGDKRTYKYMVDISPDGRSFFRIADKSKEGGSSWQNMIFPLQLVKAVRIHGLYNSAGNRKFHVLELEGYEIASPEHMREPIVWR